MKHNHCVACGTTDHICQHHLVPRSLGGSDDEINLMTLCGSCHAKIHQVQANWRHGELTRRAMQRKKARGERTGSIPYGYRLANDGKTLTPDDTERTAIQQARDLRDSGLSLAAVSKELDRRGIHARNVQTFQATQIQRMVA